MEISNMSFFGMTTFDPKTKNNSRGITLTVCEYSINIPQSTYKAIGKPKHFEIGFNDTKHFFGLKPVQNSTKFSIPVTGAKGGPSISKASVCEKIASLKPFDRKKENLILSGGSFDKESGYWLFDLDDGYTLARIRKGAK